MNMFILPKATDSEPDTVLSIRLNEWEDQNGKKLPNSYKILLSIANGGEIYPNIVENTTIQEIIPYADIGFFFSILYDWDTSLSNSEGGAYGAGTPSKFLFLGNEPGGLEFLLSLRDKDFGHVYGWPHSSNIWGTDGNDEGELIFISSSFAEFLANLSDNDEKDGLDFFGGEEELKRAIIFNVEDLK